ncbi:pentapeptide repeat-containing protein [Agromyces lapidis]|uniref:Pentapeptide repeat-containing protein n=1 Tax=Agromyces lapidis TaxID=279574 RepID=A0ABV5SU44_9MICO|nr:pentapeptide repeat-containing protein [Agromyces lapidis]
MKQPRLAAPRIDELRLVDLVEGDEAELSASQALEGRRFTGLDLSERDLTGLRLTECELRGVVAHDARLRGSVIRETLIERLEAPVLHAPRAELRDVEISGSRLGSVEFIDNRWQSVRFVGCKLGFVNLRGSELRDLRFTDCDIEELDLGNARAERVAFDGCELRALAVTGATLRDVDLRGLDFTAMSTLDGIAGLRGATLDHMQVALLAPSLASHLGIRIAD